MDLEREPPLPPLPTVPRAAVTPGSLLSFFFSLFFSSPFLMALGNFGGWGWGEARGGGGGEREKPREGEEFLQLRSLIPAARCQGGPSQEHGMPSQTVLPFSLFRPFKNIRSILGEGGRKFPSPRPARPHSQQKREREKKIKIKKTTPKHPKARKPEKGKRSGDAPGRLRSPAGREGVKGGRRTGGGARALREPRQGPQELPNEHHATFPQSGRSPRLPLAPGRPAGRSARGEQLEPCLHSRSAEVGEKAAFHLAKNAPRRRGSSPSRPPRLFSRLLPLRVSPGRALSQGDFCPPRHRFPAALPAAQRGGARQAPFPLGKTPGCPAAAGLTGACAEPRRAAVHS